MKTINYFILAIFILFKFNSSIAQSSKRYIVEDINGQIIKTDTLYSSNIQDFYTGIINQGIVIKNNNEILYTLPFESIRSLTIERDSVYKVIYLFLGRENVIQGHILFPIMGADELGKFTLNVSKLKSILNNKPVDKQLTQNKKAKINLFNNNKLDAFDIKRYASVMSTVI